MAGREGEKDELRRKIRSVSEERKREFEAENRQGTMLMAKVRDNLKREQRAAREEQRTRLEGVALGLFPPDSPFRVGTPHGRHQKNALLMACATPRACHHAACCPRAHEPFE